MPVSPEIGRVEDSCAQAPPSAPRIRRVHLTTLRAVLRLCSLVRALRKQPTPRNVDVVSLMTSPLATAAGLTLLVATVLWASPPEALPAFGLVLVGLALGFACGYRTGVRDRGRT